MHKVSCSPKTLASRLETNTGKKGQLARVCVCVCEGGARPRGVRPEARKGPAGTSTEPAARTLRGRAKLSPAATPRPLLGHPPPPPEQNGRRRGGGGRRGKREAVCSGGSAGAGCTIWDGGGGPLNQAANGIRRKAVPPPPAAPARSLPAWPCPEGPQQVAFTFARPSG